MANEVSERVKLMNPGNLDFWYGPYASVNAANLAVPQSVREGKTVCIMSVEYWWRFGINNSDLVPKNSGNADLSSLVFNETPTGLVNGVNASYQSLYGFKPESLVVKSNGLTLKPIDEYTTTGNNEIQLTFSPQIGEVILIDYIKI